MTQLGLFGGPAALGALEGVSVTPLGVLRLALFAAGVAPVFLGANMVFSPAGNSARIAKALSSARLDTSDEHRLGVIYTGLYVLSLGLLLLMAAWSPTGQGDVIRAGGLLLVARGLQRYFRGHELASAYGVAANKNWGHISWLCGIGLMLIVLAPYAPAAVQAELKVTYALRQIVLGMMTLHSVVVGALLTVWPAFALQLCALLTGATKIPRSAQFLYIVQPLGLYMITFGLMAGIAQRAGSVPRLSEVLGLLLIARAAARWFTSDMLRFAFGVSLRTLAWEAAGLAAAGVLIGLGSTRP